MTLETEEFIRRFLLHLLPKGFRRIRHFGFLANACRAANLVRIRAALEAPEPPPPAKAVDYRERSAILTGHRLDLARLRRPHGRDCPCAALANTSLRHIMTSCSATSRASAFLDISSSGNGAVICPAFQRGGGPLASMKFAMRGADQSDAL